MFKARWLVVTIAGLAAAACTRGLDVPGGAAVTSSQALDTAGYNELNRTAGAMVLYEAQVRVANACHPNVGSVAQRSACRTKVAPPFTYRAEATSCATQSELSAIKLGTLDDMLGDTADFRSGITLRYVKEKVAANTLWLMPIFPNNDRWHLPDGCDNLGSPYAVRDYLHASGTLSRRCIAARSDEYGASPCWGNDEVDALVAQAHARGLKVMLDVALNHFGHNYLMYDYTQHSPLRERAMRGDNLDALWSFADTYEPELLHPDVLDSAEKLQKLADNNAGSRSALDLLRARCPDLAGDELVRGFNIWREAFDGERATFDCKNVYLELGAPGFYLGSNRYDPSTSVADTFTKEWEDVKFLFHREENRGHSWEFVRTREYLFRVLNYWVSRGVDGFRFDHADDPDSGSGSNEWKYLTSKLDYYAWRRGQGRPVYLAEEFQDPLEVNKVVDVMIEGYAGDMAGRYGVVKDTAHIEAVLSNMARFGGHAFTMTALETHDEVRLLDGTGLGMWTGAGFWGIGATTRSTPMILMGQELGESRSLGFRRSDFLHARFEGADTDSGQQGALTGYYAKMISERLRPENRALVAPGSAFLRSRWTGQPDPRIFAQVKWSDDANVVFVFHNLWEQAVAQSYFIDGAQAAALGIGDDSSYRLYDVLADRVARGCTRGADLKWDFYVAMDAATRAQWLRLETCP